MQHYRVTWGIDIDAETPRQAAEQALAIHRNPESIATIFDVWPDNDSPLRIDLSDTEEV